MNTQFTEDQKKKVLLFAVAGCFAGIAIGTMMAFYLKDKQIAKLEAKIFKLEGWQ